MREDVRELVQDIDRLKGLSEEKLAIHIVPTLDTIRNVLENLAEEIERLDAKVDQNYRMQRGR